MYELIQQYIEFYEIKLLSWGTSFSNIESDCEIKKVIIGSKIYGNDRRMKLSLGWVTRTFDEGIKEIIASNIKSKQIIRLIFK